MKLKKNLCYHSTYIKSALKMRHYNLPPNIWLAQAALTEELYTEKQQQILPLQRNVTISDAIRSILVMITSHDIVRIANCLKKSKTKIDLIAVSVHWYYLHLYITILFIIELLKNLLSIL